MRAGSHHSPETRERLRQSQLGRKRSPRSPETREKLRQASLGNKSALGHKPSDETRAKIGRALRNRCASPESRQKMRQAHLGHKLSPETREKMRQANLGKILSAETREKIRQARMRPEAQDRMRQRMLGHSVSPEAREKIRQAALERKNSPEARERRRQAHLGHSVSPEAREKLRQAAIKRMASAEARENLRQARLRQVLPTKDTSIECLLRAEFKKRRLHFEMHKTMFGRWQPDFVFESARLIVQADGDYWHSRPDKKATDSAFDKAAAAAGWSVWRFGEREIHMHAPACARAVARFVRDH